VAWPVLAGDHHAGYDPSVSAGSRSDDASTDRVVWLVDELATELGRDDVLDGMGEVELTRRVACLHRLEGLAGLHLAATSRAARVSGVVDRSGAGSTTDWLKTATGRSGRDAARLARLGANLADLPGTARALADGDLTVEGADVVVQAATDGRLGQAGDLEAVLLDEARTQTPDQLRATVRRKRHAADGAALWRDEQHQHDARRASLTRRDDGMWDLYALLTGEVGAKVATAMNAADHPDGPDTPHDHRRTPPQRRADALEHLIDLVLDAGMVATTGGIARPHLSVHVDADTLRTDLTDTHGTDGGVGGGVGAAAAPDDPAWNGLAAATTDWGDVVSPQAVRRLLCDAAVSRIVLTGRSQVLDVGRTTRSWSEPQRRAINARDRGCRGPGCTRPIAWTHIHHLHWWRNNGHTAVTNGLALCHHCHRLVHDHHWTVHLDPTTATTTWHSPDGHTTTTRPHHPQPDGPDPDRPTVGPVPPDPQRRPHGTQGPEPPSAGGTAARGPATSTGRTRPTQPHDRRPALPTVPP